MRTAPTAEDHPDFAPVCGEPCYGGGSWSASRRGSGSDLGWMFHCNRKVAEWGQRCWQHVAK